VKLSRRSAEPEAAETDVVDDGLGGAASKGRPTPKRRDAQGRRGPVTAPKTRKEAYARQKQMTREQKSTRKRTSTTTTTPGVKAGSAAEQRAALKRGDPSALPRRDQGKTRKLARDYVDSHRMLSNYLLAIFPLMIIAAFIPKLWFIQFVVIFAFLVFVAEWYVIGRRVRALSMERFGEAQGGNLSIGFYAGSRAYLPRRWRLPGPQVEQGDTI
jgi:DUF3043 family protein